MGKPEASKCTAELLPVRLNDELIREPVKDVRAKIGPFQLRSTFAAKQIKIWQGARAHKQLIHLGERRLV